MSYEPVLAVKGLAKCFHVYDDPKDRLLQMLCRGRRTFYREFWALHPLSFEVYQGETVGIVGRNGSGKSTLLQLICGTLNPTQGYATVEGRIAALLELGAGFNPDFTGRDNVYLNGAILGLTREAIEARFDSIAEFSEIGDFMDQPVRSYSSGMALRLAFSVAIHVEPDILVVDEALSVGDERFQRKCFSKIESIREQGATILFVSHAASQVIQLCDRALLLDQGELIDMGSPKAVISHYQQLLYAPPDQRGSIRTQLLSRKGGPQGGEIAEALSPSAHEVTPDGERQHPFLDPHLIPTSTVALVSRGAEILNPQIMTLDGRPVNHLLAGERYQYAYTVRFSSLCLGVRFGMMIKLVSGTELGGGTTSRETQDLLAEAPAGALVEVKFDFHCCLNPGTYFMNAGVLGDVEGEEVFLHRLLDALMFRVLPGGARHQTGVVDFDCSPRWFLS